MYLTDVTSDDIRVALVPVSKNQLRCMPEWICWLNVFFYNAERTRLIEHNPSAGISAKGGIPAKGREALTDEQVKTLLDAIRGLRPYVFIMIGLYAGLRREEILALQWDCVFLDVTLTPCCPTWTVRNRLRKLHAPRGRHRKKQRDQGRQHGKRINCPVYASYSINVFLISAPFGNCFV